MEFSGQEESAQPPAPDHFPLQGMTEESTQPRDDATEPQDRTFTTGSSENLLDNAVESEAAESGEKSPAAETEQVHAAGEGAPEDEEKSANISMERSDL